MIRRRFDSRRAGILVGAICATALACASTSPDTDTAVAEHSIHEVNGTRLYVRTIGSGEPIVLVHGGPGMDHTYLLPGMRGLAERYRLILYDQRGGGRSGGPVDSVSITFDNFLTDLDELRASLGLEQLDLLGHSFGGLIAIRYALAYPERVRSLILVNTVEPGRRYAEETAANQRERRTPEDSAAFADLLNSQEFRERDPGAINRLFRLSFRSTFADPEHADELVIDLDERTARSSMEIPQLLMEPLGDYDYWDELESIRARTLVIHGTEDLIPIAMARELCAEIPRCTLVPISDAGHFPYVEAPDSTFAAIDAFLTR